MQHDPEMTSSGGRRPRSAPRRGEKVASRVARLIVREIVDSERRPGDGLEAESQMLHRLGVSRGSLREGLRILETQGLIVIRPGPGGGPSVANVSSREFGQMATLFFQVTRVTISDLVQARLVIEPVMARIAAERSDSELERELDAVVAAHDPALPDDEWLAVTDRFHATVCAMSGNPLLGLLAGALKEIYTDRVSGFVFPAANRDDVCAVHAEIAAAIVGGDAATAERLMHEHMERLARFFAARYPGLMDEVVDWR